MKQQNSDAREKALSYYRDAILAEAEFISLRERRRSPVCMGSFLSLRVSKYIDVDDYLA